MSNDALLFIERYDLSFLADRLEGRGTPRVKALASVSDLKALMLAVAKYPERNFAAWGRVEDALHEFILDTARYRSFTMKAVGGFIDHDPTAFGTDAFRAAWANTVAVMAEEFGIALNPDPDAGEGADQAAICMVNAAICMVSVSPVEEMAVAA